MRRLAGALVVAILAASPAFATEGPPVVVVVPPPATLPVQGAAMSVDFQITSHVDATITNVSFTSELADPENPLTGYWLIQGHNAPASMPVTAFQPVVVTVQTTCRDPNEQLAISFDVDGVRFEQSVYLVPIGLWDLWAEIDPSPSPASAVDPSHAIPGLPLDARGPAPATLGGEDAPSMTGAGPLRVSGQVVYKRDGLVEVGADGVLVRVWDRDSDDDDLIGVQTTDAWGRFDIQTFWNQSEDPDVYVQVYTANSAAQVRVPGGYTPYGFESGTTWNFTGSHLALAKLTPSDPDQHVPLHILTTASRAWRFLNSRGYGGIPEITYWWPENVDPPFYSSAGDIVHMNTERQWRESSILHEFGHHFNSSFGASNWDDYCNAGGFGDSPGDCGHTVWCPEDGGVAWNEGIAEFFMNVVIDDIESTWGPVGTSRPVEDAKPCGGLGSLGGYLTTEGILAAFAYDIADGANETDDDARSNGRDLLSFGARSVLDIVSLYRPTTPAAFLAAVQNSYPAEMTKIWATAANNGYNFDSTPPPDVATFGSTSHATTGDDPNDVVDLFWSAVSDAQSGVNDYRLQIATNPSYSGAQEFLTGNTTNWSTPSLAPATYYFRIQAWDNAGNLPPGWKTFGPVTIRPATPADLLPFAGAWPSPVVPRFTTGSTIASAPLPGTLFGDTQSTYYNRKTANQGEAAATGSHRVEFYEDGVLIRWYDLVNLSGQTEHVIVDDGPWLVRGGRHTLTLETDTEGTLAEPNEANNFWHTSYVWLPTAASTTWQARTRPPGAWAGFDDHNAFSSANCDAVRYTANTASFHAVVVRPQLLENDYDLRGFAPSAGPTDGFETLEILASSSRPAGCLDAVVNHNGLTPDNFLDAGIYDFGSETPVSYHVRRFDSISMSAGVDVPIAIAAGDGFALRSVSIPGGWPTTYATLKLTADPALGPIHVAVIDPADAQWGLDDPGIAGGVTDGNGQVVLHWTYPAPLHGVVIWQDPKDNPQFPTPQALAVTVRVEPTPPDMKPVEIAGWYEPLVPSHGAPGTPGSAPSPSQLEGNTATTYYNAAIRNDGPNATGAQDLVVYRDGEAATGSQIAQLAGFTNFTRNYATAFTVPGGRHTISLLADVTDAVDESDELNNAYGMQWVWSPLQMAVSGGWVSRAAPPLVDGGWDHLFQTAGFAGPAWFNSDGLRTPTPAPSGGTGHWMTVATMTDPGSDVDLRLHDADVPLNGFDAVREVSTWSGAEPDYVLVNFRAIMPRPFDVGVTRVAGTGGYWYQHAVSALLGTNPIGQFGTFVLASNQIVRLHEIWLDAGAVRIELENNAGTVDWGMTLHRAGLAYQSRSNAIDGTTAWLDGGPGANESIDAIVPESGYYCLAVYRATGRTSGAGRYYLNFSPSTDAPAAGLPSVTRLVGAMPNPFTPRTALRFELARPAHAELHVYDLRGARVRTLQDGALPAGRHERWWDGTDRSGRRLAGGVYFARMHAEGVTQVRKVLLVR